MVRLTDRPDMTLDVYRGRKTRIQQQQRTMMHMLIRVSTQETEIQPEQNAKLGSDQRLLYAASWKLQFSRPR